MPAKLESIQMSKKKKRLGKAGNNTNEGITGIVLIKVSQAG